MNRQTISQNHSGTLILLVLVFLSLVCSIVVSGREPDVLLAVRFFGSLCLVTTIAMVSLAIGLSLFEQNRRSILSVSLAFLVGYGSCGMLIFFIGLAHGLYPWVIAACFVGLGLIFRRNLNDLPGLIRQLLVNVHRAQPGIRWIVTGVAIYICFLFIVSLGPVHAWDAHAFHWTVAKYFARHHAVPFPFFDLNGGTPHLMRMLYTTFCVFEFTHQASHANWLLFPALVGVISGFARRLSSSAAGLAIAIAAFVFLVLRPSIVTEPMLDFPVLVFGLAAFICTLAPLLHNSRTGKTHGSAEVPDSRFFILSGILCGFALAIKWHALVLFPVILAIYLFIWLPIMTPRSPGRLLIGWMVFAFWPVAIFFVYNFVHTGNPVWHPMIPSFWDRGYWSGVAPNLFLCRIHMDFLRHNSYPSPVIAPLGFLSFYLRSIVLVLPGMFFASFALLADRRRFGAITLSVIGGGLFSILAYSILVGANPRNTLLGTGMILLLIPIGWDHLMQSKYRKIVLVVPVLIAAGLLYKVSDRRLPMIEQYFDRCVSVLRGPYLNEQYREAFLYPAAQWINGHLPADAKIITDARLLGNVDRDWMTIWPVAQCIVPVSSEMSSDSLRQSLRGTGVTHLMVDKSRLWKTTTACPLMANHLTPWENLTARKEWLIPVYSDRFVDVFQLR